jgi:hypothetical protein
MHPGSNGIRPMPIPTDSAVAVAAAAAPQRSQQATPQSSPPVSPGRGTGNRSFIARLQEQAQTNSPRSLVAASTNAVESASPAISQRNEAISKNWNQALERYNAFFSPSPEHIEEQRGVSEIRVGQYLSLRAEAENKGPVPDEVRRLMVELDMAIGDVHRALPFGRGNVLVRNQEALQSNVPQYAPAGIDINATLFKAVLVPVARRLERELSFHESFEPGEPDANMAAGALLMGGGNCHEYTNLLSFPAAEIVGRYQESFSSLQLSFIDDAELPNPHQGKDPNSPQSIEVDHVFLQLSLTTKDQREFEVLLDPWADHNTPLLDEHIAYDSGDIDMRFEVPPADHQKWASDKELVLAKMHDANNILLEGHKITQEDFECDALISDLKHPAMRGEKSHTMLGGPEGEEHVYVNRENTTIVENITLPPGLRRRPSLAHAGESPLAMLTDYKAPLPDPDSNSR